MNKEKEHQNEELRSVLNKPLQPPQDDNEEMERTYAELGHYHAPSE